MENIGELLALAPVIPVLTLEGAADGVPVARALVAGGLPVLEVTLRTPGALEAARAIADAVPGAVVGVGTVVAPAQFDAARRAGARFAVSPGHTPALLAAAEDAGMPYLPGMASVSEAMALAERGYRALKFFPAESCGGAGFLRALQAPLPELRFCPTGGIDSAKAEEYLALPNVPCVGGSWPVPAAAVRAGNWDRIEALAHAAASLRANPAA
ncbi:bifunctional 4-hydroxy-2-oxoglutarate aldolase/2-dehydro-3-deoxy-phosphogluconate aldolase [Vineibacter terrae]|uniref:bifunctional 4-hydroxy-2-oxoglutarate aldolase/2-dehydro-3-deoxy-phosphogluconate aldolase n=1 Tax=Vineibacter terrae TaxID=2586908 RepID=UPI002E3193B5|nr:bifunctional 4-hydroxy-2-oxoglutarate aldolase/2-dehydro-3-deoxy-phosphogluconate aldolase [Vineibacter terrae]HEX2890350.1 bifunctional 4-hydroxy-2-oxoglutarate aldolase/2-dehydro-3-deoxy-phosphogluconate aldolase [Vineibacter terrae]